MKQVQNKITIIQFCKRNNLNVSSKYKYGTEEYSRIQTPIDNLLENILRKTRKKRYLGDLWNMTHIKNKRRCSPIQFYLVCKYAYLNFDMAFIQVRTIQEQVNRIMNPFQGI